MADSHKNFAASTVAAPPSPATSGGTLSVKAGQGVLFPTPPFNATVWPQSGQPTSANSEIVRVTGISGDTFTFTRTQEGTNARAIVVGDQIIAGITAKTITDIEAIGAGTVTAISGPLPTNAVLIGNGGTDLKSIGLGITGTVLAGITSGAPAFRTLVESDITGLVADLALPRTPTAHASTHSSGGSDPVTVTALAGFPGGTANFLRADGAFSAPSSAASNITGTTLASNVVASSLTSVGVLGALTVTAPIVGSLSGNATTTTAFQTGRAINGVTFDGTAPITVTAAATTLTGTTLAATVVNSSLTSIGALSTIVVGGTTSPNGVEGYFASTSASDPRGVMSAQYSTDTTGARIHLRKARGTEALPTTLVTGDVLGRIRFSGYDSASYLQSGSIDVVSTGTIAATRLPTYMAFSVATDAAPSVLTEVFRLTSVGGGQITNNGLATTSADGLVLQNTTLSSGGVTVQYSPRMVFRGTAWNSVGSASESDSWAIENRPGTNAGATTHALTFLSSLAGAAYMNLGFIDQNGMMNMQSFSASNNNFYQWSGRSRLLSPANAQVNFTNQANTTGIGFDFSTDGLLKVRTRAQTANASISVGADAIATTSTDGHVIANDTVSTVGIPVQMSPRLRFRSHVWNTTVTAADNTQDWWIESVPTSAGVPTGLLKIVSSLNGAAGVQQLSIDTNGTLIPSAVNLSVGSGLNSSGDVTASATRFIVWNARSALWSPLNGQVNLSNSAQTSGIGLDLNTDTVLKVRTRAQTGNASISVGADALAVTSTDGALIANDTLSTAGVPVQQSPRLRLRSHVWNTTATAVDNTNDWWIESVPVSGATPSGFLKFMSSLNGAAATAVMQLTNLPGQGGLIASKFSNTSTVALQDTNSGINLGLPTGGFTLNNNGSTVGSFLKIDALPTVASGGGTSPAVTAGSTPFAGSVNVGTGVITNPIVINFNGTAFPSAPFCIAVNDSTAAVLRCSATTTQLTITGLVTFTAGDVISWHCISSK